MKNEADMVVMDGLDLYGLEKGYTLEAIVSYCGTIQDRKDLVHGVFKDLGRTIEFRKRLVEVDRLIKYLKSK